MSLNLFSSINGFSYVRLRSKNVTSPKPPPPPDLSEHPVFAGKFDLF
jgi:hypothetical protein